MDQTEMSSDLGIITADELDQILVPWHWDDVILERHGTEQLQWCTSMKLEFGIDFHVHTTGYTSVIYRQPGTRRAAQVQMVHHWLFKDPKYATMFRLRWL